MFYRIEELSGEGVPLVSLSPPVLFLLALFSACSQARITQGFPFQPFPKMTCNTKYPDHSIEIITRFLADNKLILSKVHKIIGFLLLPDLAHVHPPLSFCYVSHKTARTFIFHFFSLGIYKVDYSYISSRSPVSTGHVHCKCQWVTCNTYTCRVDQGHMSSRTRTKCLLFSGSEKIMSRVLEDASLDNNSSRKRYLLGKTSFIWS